MKAATKNGKVATPQNDISIHAAREGGDGDIKFLRRKLMISIHAAREGGDVPADEGSFCVNDISIHAAREGGD